jgi:hypothetical protein
MAAALLVGTALPTAPTARADPVDQVRERCRAQYQAGAGYSEGIPYLAPPGDSYSWRCKQVSLSGGGAITDLPVNLVGIAGG